MIPIIERSKSFDERIAILDNSGSYSYAQLYADACTIARNLLQQGLKSGEPVLFLVPSGYQYVAMQWGIWLAGGIAVPVHIAHPVEEIAYLLEDTGAHLFIHSAALKDKAVAAAANTTSVISFEQIAEANTMQVALPDVRPAAGAMLIYTSGTTGKPKGVLISHAQLTAQIASLTEAWEWTSNDYILNMLPMHHVHGIVNITCCALYNGATCEMYPSFDEAQALNIIATGRLSLFMAVPTIYHKLIRHFEQADEESQKKWFAGMQHIRLMVCGSAALPVPVLEKWKSISGHVLLERYGMTEIGMALSNPLHGERMPGYVGKPLPGVAVILADDNGRPITEVETPGQLYIKGDTVFKEYWNRPEETAKSFDNDWFKTGDIATVDVEGNYKILGRNSTDIIKSGGYKISALEIEQLLLEHPAIVECAVVALPDEEWGECIAAAYVGDIDADEIKVWVKEKLAPYKLPRRWLSLPTLPRNAMGKIIKTSVKEMFAEK